MPWDTPISNPEWEQDWGSTVRIRNAVEQPLRDDLDTEKVSRADERVGRPAAEWARLQILENAAGHITRALSELEQALDWFGVVDRSDHGDLVRQVESLADTIGYRLRNARE